MNVTPEQEHALEWSDRLQDRLDGDLDAAQAALVDAHVQGCAACSEQMAALRVLDLALVESNPPLELEQSFDERLFDRIDHLDQTQRTATRRRAEQELREQLDALSRSWRRTLAFVLPGVVAGLAVAFALAGWLFSVDVAELFTRSAQPVSDAMQRWIEAGVIAALGATVGALIARWMAVSAD